MWGGNVGLCVTKDYSDIYLDDYGWLNMNNSICDVTDPTQYVDYYTFGVCDTITTWEIYRIKETSGSIITKADMQYYVPKEGEGLVKTSDDDGTSYIYRGEINNNYVSFADKLWRIVRINGDGTIRIILDDKINELSNIKFNNNASDKKYVGYTYDNGKSCTNKSPCDTNTGVSSTIKQALETWYQNNLQKYDDKIALTKYCNDTTGSEDGSLIIYGAKERIENNDNAILTCPDTDKNYGGVYKLKIGLLTADEVMYGGIPYNGLNDIAHNYLYREYLWWSMSPYGSRSSSVYELFSVTSTLISDSINYTNNTVRPVINLKSDVTVTGSGTQEDPYVVQ